TDTAQTTHRSKVIFGSIPYHQLRSGSDALTRDTLVSGDFRPYMLRSRGIRARMNEDFFPVGAAQIHKSDFCIQMLTDCLDGVSGYRVLVKSATGAVIKCGKAIQDPVFHFLFL